MSILLTLFTGCAGWRGLRDTEVAFEPEEYTYSDVSSGSDLAMDSPWWETFDDEILDSLMILAFNENPTLEQMALRLRQSDALFRQAKSYLIPGLTLSGSASERGYLEEPLFVNPQQQISEQPSYGLSLGTSYEIDLWGKVKSGYSAAKMDYLAGQEDMKAMVLTTSGLIARTYFSVIEIRQQVDLLRKSVEAYQNSYNLVLDRYKRGIVRSLDVYQAKTALAGSKAQLAKMETTLVEIENGFAVLLGLYPQVGVVPADAEITGLDESYNASPPSELVNNRPDVTSSLLRLSASDYRAAQAVASRLPSFSLSASIDKTGGEVGDLFDPEGMIWNAIGNITAPVFYGGRLKAEADRAEAAYEESLSFYRQTLLNAYNEVEVALINQKNTDIYYTNLSQQAESAKSTLRLQNDYYLRGVSNYLAVTTAQTTYFNTMSSLISAKREKASSRITLALALGGNWMQDIIDNYVVEED